MHITKNVICRALKVSQMGAGFREKRPNLKVYNKKSALPTFHEIANKDAVILTQIYSQCIMTYSKRPQRFKTPHGVVE